MPMTHGTRLRGLKFTIAAAAIAVGVVACTELPTGGGDEQARPGLLAEENVVYALVPQSGGSGTVRRAAAGLGYTAGADIDLDALGMILVRFDLPEGVTGPDAIGRLEAAVPASTVGVNHAYRLQVNGTGDASRNYANALLNWPQGGCPTRVRIGVIDGGVDPEATALTGAQIRAAQFGTGSPESLRHGTEVASVLADPSRLRDVSLMTANVISQTADGTDVAGAAQIVQALDWMAEEGVRVVNMSLAGPENKLLRLAVESAADRGIVMVAAAGNLGPGAAPQFPAAFPDVIAVTAVDADMAIYRGAVRGAHIDIAAPGVDIFVPIPNGGRYVTGTSMASAFVAARLATARSPGLDILLGSSLDLGPDGRDDVFGLGLLQADGAC
jgi:hypothetical protein